MQFLTQTKSLPNAWKAFCLGFALNLLRSSKLICDPALRVLPRRDRPPPHGGHGALARVVARGVEDGRTEAGGEGVGGARKKIVTWTFTAEVSIQDRLQPFRRFSFRNFLRC